MIYREKNADAYVTVNHQIFEFKKLNQHVTRKVDYYMRKANCIKQM